MTEPHRAREPRIVFLAIVLAGVPFVFALIRAFQTGTDFRYLWMAFAALIAAASVIAIGRAHDQRPNVVLALSGVAFVTATLVTVLMGRLLGARSAMGIGVVSVAFALFSAAGQALYALSRRREI